MSCTLDNSMLLLLLLVSVTVADASAVHGGVIAGRVGDTNGWALDTLQVAGVQHISWLVRVYRV